MPGKLLKRAHYDLVDETSDSKIPVHTDEAFDHGIRFKAKYIGMKDIAKPNSRSEIVTAMRRIRYEYKMQGSRKEKVEVQISVDGLRVVQKIRKKKQDVEKEISNYPVHRVFYVSHDSQDLQIFSYIAKDGETFKCFVFKANSKALAMHIVRSVGQAFEVCHKKNLDMQQNEQTQGNKVPNGNDEKHPGNEAPTAVKTDGDGKDADEGRKDQIPPSSLNVETQAPQSHPVGDVSFWTMDAKSPVVSLTQTTPVGPVNIEQLQKIYQQQLEQQRQETQAAVLQANTYRQQLEIQTQARAETQSQLEAALKQNKELIVTVQHLLNQALQSQQGATHVTSTLSELNRKNLSPINFQAQSSTPSPHNTTADTSTRTEPPVSAIPPPPHNSSSALFLGGRSGSATPSHLPSVSNGIETTTLVDLKDSEMVEPRQVEPLPQQFLQFAFDQSSTSDRYDTLSHPSLNSLTSELSQATSDVPKSLTGTPKGMSLVCSSQQHGKNTLNGT